MNPILISQLHTWANHEANVREVVLKALLILVEEKNLPIKEDDVSERLLDCIKRANNRLLREGCGVHYPIIPQATSNKKRPDFQWGMIDENEEDPLKADRHLTIECKRLGKTSSGHALNTDYVKDGVLRFTTEEHRYGKGTDSGIMIGYVQDMDLAVILKKVNVAIKKHALPPLEIPNQGWQKRGVSHLEHWLDRPFPVTPFLLRHFWVDLRHCYPSILNKVPKT